MSEILSDLNNKSDDYSDILFDRPINNLFKKNVAILVGRHVSLKQLNIVYTTLIAMGFSPIVVADFTHEKNSLPADLYLQQKKSIYYENTDSAIELINDCHTIVALFGRELNSAMQVFITKFLKDFRGRVVSDFISLPSLISANIELITYGTQKDIWGFTKHNKDNTQKVSLVNKAKVLSEYCSKAGSSVVSVDSNQAVAMHKDELDKVAVVNTSSIIDKNALISIFASLLTNSASEDSKQWLRIFQATGYLYRNGYGEAESPEQLKKFLDNQFF